MSVTLKYSDSWFRPASLSRQQGPLRLHIGCSLLGVNRRTVIKSPARWMSNRGAGWKRWWTSVYSFQSSEQIYKILFEVICRQHTCRRSMRISHPGVNGETPLSFFRIATQKAHSLLGPWIETPRFSSIPVDSILSHPSEGIAVSCQRSMKKAIHSRCHPRRNDYS